MGIRLDRLKQEEQIVLKKKKEHETPSERVSKEIELGEEFFELFKSKVLYGL